MVYYPFFWGGVIFDVKTAKIGMELPPTFTECGAGDSTYNQKSDGLLRRQAAAQSTHTIKYYLGIAVMEKKKKSPTERA